MTKLAKYSVKLLYIHFLSSSRRPHNFQANLLVKVGGYTMYIRKPH